jgi:hypothetical protein
MVQDGEVLMMKHVCKCGIIVALLLMLLAAAIPSAYAVPLQPSVYEQAFSADHALTGLFATFTESFYAGDWAVEQAVFSMSYDVTQLVYAKYSTYTVSVNGQKVYSAQVPLTFGAKQRVQITLPPETIKAGVNYLTVETYIRTNDQEPCVDDVSKANWMNVLKDSAITLSYRPLAVVGSVAALYKQFTSIDALSGKQSAFVVGEDAGESSLSCAAMAMAGIAGNVQLFYENIGLVIDRQGGALFQDPYQIYISRYDQLAGGILSFLTPQQASAAQTGIALVLLNREDRYVLAAIGADDTAMVTLGRLLGNAAYMAQLQDPWSGLAKDLGVLTPAVQVQPYMLLTDSGAYVKGTFRQNASFFIQYPKNRTLSYESRIRLIFRYAENLDFDRSLVTVYINENPIGSKKLSIENAKGDSLELSIPTDLKVSGSFSVRVAFDLEIKDLWCTQRQEETPWAYVSSESMLKLSSVDVLGLLFDNYPSPFVLDGKLNDVAVVLPARPSDADYEVFRKMMLTMGRYVSDNSGSLTVYRGVGKGSVPAANVISIGRFGVNQIAMDHNQELFFRFSQDGTTIDSNEKMLIEPNYGTRLGSAQLLYSPLSGQKRALLVISGVSDEAMLKTLPYLGSVEGIWKVYGDGFVADGETAHSFRFKADNAAMAPAAFKILERQDVLGLSLAAGGVLLLTLFAISMMMMKHRRRK